MKNFPILFNFILVFSALYIVAAIVYFISGFPYGIYGLISAIVPLIFLIMRVAESRNFIDNKISSLIGNLKDYSVYTKSLPGYRFVDVYNSVLLFSSQAPSWTQMESQHTESLAQILNGEFFTDANRRIKIPERIARPISERAEGFFPSDNFWLRAPSLVALGGIIRVRLQNYTHEVVLEVGAKEQHHAQEIIKQVLKLASEHSIFKNKMIEVSFEQEVKDAYGDIERNEKVDPIFLEKPPVTADDIILDKDTWRIIERSIVDFHERRQELMKAGLPGRRGVLFYGPPGTGKTYTCRYISNRLNSATTIVAAGMSLLHIKSICNIARMLQPSVVILEDVDLVYSERDRNIYTTALGELMDELDGFNPEDHIIFILTTNAIDRVETAIRERPGRISQCIYFGAPSVELRRQYLESMLAPYNCLRLNMDKLIAQTEGVTQAFLKELVYRAVQIATESQAIDAEIPALSNEHFREALDEMRMSAGRSGEAIIGFRIER
jgi:SpoVK/Ycf46/Vps4 family AAA+-type ATPase